MCGTAGYLRLRPENSAPISADVARGMLAVIRRGGPDGEDRDGTVRTVVVKRTPSLARDPMGVKPLSQSSQRICRVASKLGISSISTGSRRAAVAMRAAVVAALLGVALLIAAQTAPATAQRLFASGFEGTTTIVPPNQANFWGTGGWTDITGTDSTTGFTWPPNIWGGGGGRFLFLTDPLVVDAANIGSYMFNQIQTVTGPKGNPTQALYQQISQNVNGTEPMGTSPTTNLFNILPSGETSDLYISYWVKFQPDLVEKMNNLPAGPGIDNGGTWRAFFAFKTGGQKAVTGPLNDPMNNGDYRVEVYVLTFGGGTPYWQVLADNNAGGGAPLVNNWVVQNRTVPVPVGEWFKFEIFWHRSNGADGRVWVAVNGNVIADHNGPNMGAWNLPINRISMPTVYTGSRMPVYQWIDDLEIWAGFPPAGTPAPTDTTAPSVPTGLAGTAASSTQINLTWNASTDNVAVTSYQIYLNNVMIANTTATSFTHSGLAAGTTYNYRVSAADAVPNYSAWTATPVSVNTLPAPASQAPATEASTVVDVGHCFIATAAYGSPMARDVRYLRAFRDQYLLTNKLGQWFVEQYYRLSPPLADKLRAHDDWRAMVRFALSPLVALSKWLASGETFEKQTADRP